MCPYYLDGDQRAAYAALGDTRVIGYCAVFKVREEACALRRPGPKPEGHRRAPVSQNSTACSRLDGHSPIVRPSRPVDILVAECQSGTPRGSDEPRATVVPAFGALLRAP